MRYGFAPTGDSRVLRLGQVLDPDEDRPGIDESLLAHPCTLWRAYGTLRYWYRVPAPLILLFTFL